MKRSTYDPAVKEKILKTVHDSRSNKRPWSETLMQAKQEGYKGSLGGLYQMIRKAEKKAKKTFQAEIKPPAKKRGRPAGKRLGRPLGGAINPAAGAVSESGMDHVHQTIQNIVRDRVQAALQRLWAAIDAAGVRLK